MSHTLAEIKQMWEGDRDFMGQDPPDLETVVSPELLEAHEHVGILLAELAKHQESEFHPDWSMLEATRGVLHEHKAELKKARERIAWLEERKLGDEVLLQNRLIGLTDQDRIIEEINAENLELIGRLAKGRPHLDGSWMAPDGTCRVCGGEIPHGHGKCDYYELEKKLKRLENAAIADSVNKAGGGRG